MIDWGIFILTFMGSLVSLYLIGELPQTVNLEP